MDLSGFGGNFTANLAATVLRHAYHRLRGWALGDEEAAALTKCFDRALSGTLEALQPAGILHSDALASEVENVLTFIFSKGTTAEALLSAALDGEGDPRQLTSLAVEAGLDPDTLPFDWEEFLVILLAKLQKAIYHETSSPGSKLRERVALAELFRLRCAVNRFTEKVEGVIDRLMAGLIEVDPVARFREFGFEYLGFSDRPKPFGGRQHEIDTLNDWLYDPDQRRKLLIVAPAGRGKSALLVHWLRQLPPDVAQVFVPISVRFESALPMTFVPALASELARLYGRPPLPRETLQNIEACRSLAASLLRQPLPDGRILVVVVDGLDEAGDRYSWAGQFPTELPENLRIVASARQVAGDKQNESWMRRLGWDSFSERVRPLQLDCLDQEGVGEVLRRMELPPQFHQAHAGFARKIHDLTAGDPLLVGLYAEQLWEQHRRDAGTVWNEAELGGLNEGLQGFFERWYREQCSLWGSSNPLFERQVHAVLAVLSQSLGPLLADELSELVRRVYKIDAWSVREALAPLARFVKGEGVGEGYTLAHPRLNEFFGRPDFLPKNERQRIKRAFLSWGKGVLRRLDTGRLNPEHAPPYLLRYLGEHYVRADLAVSEFVELLNIGWIEAWEFADPTYRGLLADVQRVWNASRTEMYRAPPGSCDSNLGLQVRCALYFGSLQSPYRNAVCGSFCSRHRDARPDCAAVAQHRRLWRGPRRF